MRLRRSSGWLLPAVVVAPLVLSGCTGGSAERAASPSPTPPGLAITPAANATDVPISAEIGVTVTGGRIAAVRLTDDKGAPVEGAMRPDGSTWVPAEPLRYKWTYRAEVVATSGAGVSATRTVRFTTMDSPARRVATTLSVEHGRTYGVAMPVTVGFDVDVPARARADVERRLFVNTDPPQPGVWHWTTNGRQVSYRAPDFWRSGTTITVRAALAGLPLDKDGYGDADHTATARIGERLTIDIDNATKQMSVHRGDRLIRTIPVSLGKPRTPTSSGKMVIMEKHASTTFDTRGEPDGGYLVTVADAQRLTWGGEFIHAAPWSVADQGVRNVSHGCTNVSGENAAWLMEVTQVGDLVTITGTEVKLESGNGWTVWDLSWDEFVRGSALPIPAGLQPATVPAPSATGSASAGGRLPSPVNSPTPVPSNAGR